MVLVCCLRAEVKEEENKIKIKKFLGFYRKIAFSREAIVGVRVEDGHEIHENGNVRVDRN
jgi:hypothetical protein